MAHNLSFGRQKILEVGGGDSYHVNVLNITELYT